MATQPNRPAGLMPRLRRWLGARDGVATVLQQARRDLDQGQLLQARDACLTRLAQDPDDVQALELLADTGLAGLEPAQATRPLMQALSRNGDVAPLLFKLGCLHEALGELEPARLAYTSLLKLEPGHAWGHNNLGAVQQGLGRTQDARASYQRAIALQPGLWQASYNLGLLEKLGGSLASAADRFREAMLARRRPDPAAIRLAPGDQRTTASKLRHDLEQLEYLDQSGHGLAASQAARAALVLALQTLEADGPQKDGWPVGAEVAPRLAPFYNRVLHLHDAPALDGGALNPALDWPAVEQAYLARAPGMAFADDFLRPEALASLRRFCLESTVWFDCNYRGGYVGCTFEDGFICPLLVQIAEELRRALPRVIGAHAITGLWGYKYDSEGHGIDPHADFAAVNVNFWITPDQASLQPERGGLVVWDKEAPLDWDFQDYNNNAPRIMAFLEHTQARSWTVPHRQNRVVLFNSDLFHRTDDYRFRPGYVNRRINITLLYGDRQRAASATIT